MQYASIYGLGIWSRASHLSVIVAKVGDDAKHGVIFNRCVADDAGPRHLTGDVLRCGIQNSRSLHTDMISTALGKTNTPLHSGSRSRIQSSRCHPTRVPNHPRATRVPNHPGTSAINIEDSYQARALTRAHRKRVLAFRLYIAVGRGILPLNSGRHSVARRVADINRVATVQGSGFRVQGSGCWLESLV